MVDKSPDTSGKKVDEAWKQKAQEETEALDREAVSEQAPEGEESGAPGRGQLPPATFLGLVSGLAAQAFVYLGFIENPVTGKKEADIASAGHLLDTLEMLKEKTDGNLDPQETAYLEDLLYNLRMAYVKESG
ncbi:MAG: DUF1844 domain-containing protein [Planctomycetes bacterium]|nr:DUF1844 domain-containing protein [Planctomycetota bacterium]